MLQATKSSGMMGSVIGSADVEINTIWSDTYRFKILAAASNERR